MSDKVKKIQELKEKVFELKSLYGESNLKITFNVAGTSQTAEKIKAEVTEYM